MIRDEDYYHAGPIDRDAAAFQRYIIAWSEHGRALTRVAAERARMVAEEMTIRTALIHNGRGFRLQLLNGRELKVCIAPNGRDIMVLPWAESPIVPTLDPDIGTDAERTAYQQGFADGQKVKPNHCPTCGAHALHWAHPINREAFQ